MASTPRGAQGGTAEGSVQGQGLESMIPGGVTSSSGHTPHKAQLSPVPAVPCPRCPCPRCPLSRLSQMSPVLAVSSPMYPSCLPSQVSLVPAVPCPRCHCPSCPLSLALTCCWPCCVCCVLCWLAELVAAAAAAACCWKRLAG